MAAARNSRLDGVKLLLIVLVVVGHCIEPTRYTNVISGSLYSVIYSFHMPLFVFLSGYFAKVNSFDEWIEKGLRFLETFLVIMIPQFLFFRSWHVFINPENSGWYLMSLAWWYGVLLIVRRIALKMTDWRGEFLSILISMVVFSMPLGIYGRVFSFNRTFQMFPFFYGGYLCRINSIKIPLESKMKNSTSYLLLAAIITMFLIYFSSRTLHVLEFYNVDAWSISKDSCISIDVLIGMRIVLMLSVVIFFIAIIEKFKIPDYLSRLGSATLVIYVIQGIFAHILPSIAPQNICVELGIAILIISISVLLIKSIDCRYLTNPISTIFLNYKRNDNEDFK